MKIVITQGKTGYYATAEDCTQKETSVYKGLLITGERVQDVLDQLSTACKELQIAKLEGAHEDVTN